MEGWISLHRKTMESAIYKDSQAVHLWVHLLLKANHKPNQMLINGEPKLIKRGQLLTGRKALSYETGINESKVQRILKTLEKCRMIEQQTSTKNRLISITNYDSYQDVNNKRTASEQQVNTNNNDNNVNNIYSLSSGDDQKPKETKKTRSPNIPYDQVFDLYNKILAQGIGLPSVQARDDERKRAIKKAWNYNKQANIDKHATNTIDYWDRYFTYCAGLAWMQPDAPRGQGHENWKPDFDYCMKTTTIKKVIEARIK